MSSGHAANGQQFPASAETTQGANLRSWAEVLGLGKEEQGEVLLEMTYKVGLGCACVLEERS